MPISVRPFRPDEAAALTAIRLQALADNPPAFAERRDVAEASGGEDFSAAVTKGTVWGLFDGGTCLGMAGLERCVGTNVEHKAMVWGVYVDPAARGQGAGQLLFAAMIAHAREAGITVRELGVGNFNAPARTLYSRMGFVPYGLERRALRLGDRYFDDVLMALHL